MCETDNNTPLMFKYRLDFRNAPKILSIWEYTDDQDWIELPDDFEKFSVLMARIEMSVYFGVENHRNETNGILKIPADSFKREDRKIRFRFNVSIGDRIIGEIWIMHYYIAETKGNLLRISYSCNHNEFKGGWFSEIRRCLQAYEREQTEYPIIILDKDPKEGTKGLIARIDNVGNLQHPVQLKKIFSNGKTESMKLDWSVWHLFDYNGNYRHYSTEIV